MKAKRKSDGKIIEVVECQTWNNEAVYTCNGMFYRACELDFNIESEITVISGWVAIDEAYGECFLHTEKPIQKAQPIADTGDYDTV